MLAYTHKQIQISNWMYTVQDMMNWRILADRVLWRSHGITSLQLCLWPWEVTSHHKQASEQANEGTMTIISCTTKHNSWTDTTREDEIEGGRLKVTSNENPLSHPFTEILPHPLWYNMIWNIIIYDTKHDCRYELLWCLTVIFDQYTDL